MKIEKDLNLGVWKADLGDGCYKNPVIYADYSDPDAIRVGDDYFMISSSFSHVPGLPLLHSKDLVNWRLANYILDRIPYEGYDLPRHGDGVWAPAIRYHEGKFWVYYPMPDEGIFMTNTEDPFGKWSEPVCVKAGKGWIDPCPFWDDDGNAYLVNGFAKSRIGFKSILGMSKMSWDGTRLIGDVEYVFDGNFNEHGTIEGPKMYKRNGYYYIFAPAGGVKPGWQTILRSKNVFGPYEDKIVLHQGDSPVNGPHQGAWVDTQTGEDWFLHFQDVGTVGRIVHLQPMRWENDWPAMGVDTNNDGTGEPVLRYKKPDVGGVYQPVTPPETDMFNSDKLNLAWQWQANPQNGLYSLSDRKGYLRLFAKAINADVPRMLRNVTALLMQKFPAPAFKATTKVDFKNIGENDRTGLIVYGEQYVSIEVCRTEDSYTLSYIQKDDTTMEYTKEKIPLTVSKIFLRTEVKDGTKCTFSYSTDGDNFKTFGDVFEAVPGRWVGAKVGIFCVNGKFKDGGYADFEYFKIED